MKRRIEIALALLLLGAVSIQSASAAGKKTSVSADALLKKYVSIWVDGNLSVVDEIIDPAVVRHHPASIQPPQIAGTDNYKLYVAAFRKMHPDLKFEVMDAVADGNTVAYRYQASALNPATNQRFTFGGIALSKLGPNGKIVEEWVTWDTFDLMVQVGIIPPRKP